MYLSIGMEDHEPDIGAPPNDCRQASSRGVLYIGCHGTLHEGSGCYSTAESGAN